MNWGYKILTVYIIFIAGIGFLVFKSSSQKMDLVTPDYYEKELKYQTTIDESNRAKALSEAVKFVVKDRQLLLYFPKDFAGKKIIGSAILYFPADKDKDSKVNFNTLYSPQALVIPTTNKGLHNLQLNWQVDGITYYFEQRIVL